MSVTNRPELLALRRLTDAIDADLVRAEAAALLQWAVAAQCSAGPRVFEVSDRESGAVVAAAIEVAPSAPETDGIERMRVVSADGAAFQLRELLVRGEVAALGDVDLEPSS